MGEVRGVGTRRVQLGGYARLGAFGMVRRKTGGGIRRSARLFFFFQAEDGIRYLTVTGVQTCALPISIVIEVRDDGRGMNRERILQKARERGMDVSDNMPDQEVWQLIFAPGFSTADVRSEERRVGKECRSRWSPYH